MAQEVENVVCGFCGQSLGKNLSVEISFSLVIEPEEVQTIFAHPSCFDKTLHASIPRILIHSKNDG